MTRSLRLWLRRLLFGSGAASLPLVLAVGMAAAEDPKPADAKGAAQEAKQDAKQDVEAAKDDVKDTKDEAREAAKESRDEARDNVRDAERGTRDVARDNRERGARDGDRDKDDDRDRKERNDAEDDRSRNDDRDRADRGKSYERGSDRGSFRSQDMRSADMGIWFDRSSRDALVISDVSTRGAIAKLGFREGDRIVSVNGRRVKREADFIEYLYADDVRNTRVKVIVLRDNAEETIIIEPNVFVEEYSTPTQQDPLERFGIILDDRYSDRLVIWKVIPRSPAYYSGMRAGDVITTFHGKPVKAHQEFVQTVQTMKPGPVDVVVDRNKQARTYQVEVPQFNDKRAGRDVNVERPNQRREERVEDRVDRRNDGAAGEGTRNGSVRTQPQNQGGRVPRRDR